MLYSNDFVEELRQIQNDVAQEDSDNFANDEVLVEVLIGAFTATYDDDPLTEEIQDMESFRYGLVRTFYRLMTVTKE